MTKRLPHLLFAATLLLSGVTPAAAQHCSTLRVDQESYGAVSELVYIYVPNVDKSAGGWNSFTVRVLVGEYRRPLLLKQGFMREADVNKLLSEHREITQYPLQVAGYIPKGAPGTKPPPSPPVGFKSDGQSITIKVVRVVLAAGVSLNSDHVLLEVCPAPAILQGLAAWRRNATTRPEDGIRSSPLMAGSEYGIEAVEPGECHVSSASNEGPKASCAVTAEKLARESGDLHLEWTYKDYYTQVIRFTLKDAGWAEWIPEAPLINMDEKRKREGYQRQTRQALMSWMAELKSGDLPRMRRASPALEAETKSEEGSVIGVTCRVSASPPPGKALCSITWQGRPTRKGVSDFVFDSLQASVTQELAIEQTQGGSLVANPVRTTRR